MNCDCGQYWCDCTYEERIKYNESRLKAECKIKRCTQKEKIELRNYLKSQKNEEVERKIQESDAILDEIIRVNEEGKKLKEEILND